MNVLKIKKVPRIPAIKPLKRGLSLKEERLEREELKPALRYITGYWQQLRQHNTKDKGSLIGLPHEYVVPAVGTDDFAFQEQYYWDSYFTILGLTGKKYEELASGMLDNLIYMLERFGLIPNASRMYFVGRSQPPLLTRYIFHIYDNYDRDKKWLKHYIRYAKTEYQEVWMSDKHPHWRQVHKGLSRYYDVNVLHDLAEAESGWDMTVRFKRKCLDHVPIDLNSLLYGYEVDFARAARILGDEEEAQEWEQQALMRQEQVNASMWSEREGFFFDYNFVSGRKSSVYSLAAYYAMWTGLASEKQAAKLVKQLPKFLHKGGLSTTTKPVLDLPLFGSVKAQWAYPNGWAPLHLIVIEGLERYGYHKEARVIAKRWLKTNVAWFERHGEFLEKYNVVRPERKPLAGVYPTQTGFGWTNGVFAYLAKKYTD